jgi:hypothetical protein
VLEVVDATSASLQVGACSPTDALYLTDYHASRQIRLGSPLVGFRERLLALHATTGLGMTRGSCKGVSPSALLQRLLSIGGRELNFQLMDLIPLGVSSPGLRYRQKFLQATMGGNRLGCIHGDIIPPFACWKIL